MQKIFHFLSSCKQTISSFLAPKIIFPSLVIAILLTPLVGYQLANAKQPFESNYFGRFELIYVYNNLKYHVLKDKLFPNLVVGQNNWLFFTGDESMQDYQKTISINDRETQNKLKGLCHWLAGQHIRFLLVIPPNKSTIYPEYMPPQIQVIGEKNPLEQIKPLLADEPNCQILDLSPDLLAKKKDAPVYYSTDSHWNTYGAYVSAEQIFLSLQSQLPVLKTKTFPRNAYKNEVIIIGGDLTTKTFGQIDLKEVSFKYSPESPDSWSEIVNLSPKEIHALTIIKNDSDSLPRAIVYQDSFFQTLKPYMNSIFSYSEYWWTYKVNPQYILVSHPDVVILEITERFLGQLWSNLPDESVYQKLEVNDVSCFGFPQLQYRLPVHRLAGATGACR